MGLTVKFISAGETWAKIKASAELTDFSISLPSGGTIISYNISGIGELTYEDLTPGTSNTLNITATCSYDYSYIETTSYTKPDGTTGTTTETKYDSGYDSKSKNFTVYTHPGAWSWGANQGETIQNCLTAEKDAIWKQRFQKVYHWKNQNALNYSFSITVKSEDPVSEEWYNDRVNALNTVRDSKVATVVGGIGGDLITAFRISQLDFSGVN